MKNREIKFRAWDKDKKLFIPTDVWAICQTDFNAFGIMLKDWENYKEGEYFYNSTQELSQFTGLKDKNGVEIYEGDIVNIPYNYIGNIIVQFTNGGFNITSYNIGKCKVIGNIYENPELIK